MDPAPLTPPQPPGQPSTDNDRGLRSASVVYQVAILAAAALLIFSAALL